MLKKLSSVALLLGFAACAHADPSLETQRAPTYTVVMDNSFSSDELSSIASGFDVWQTGVGPDLAFTYLTAERSDINNSLASNNPPANTVYVMSVADLTTVNCFLMASNVACFVTPNRIYMQPDIITALGVWPKITAHEAGHAIGLQHSGVPFSVMQSTLADMSTTPLKADIDDYCSLQPDGCPHRPADAGK